MAGSRRLWRGDNGKRGFRATRPGGLEPPTCGFSDPELAFRAGPSLRRTGLDPAGAGRFGPPSVLRGGIVGATHPLASTPSAGSGAPPVGSARDYPRGAGFPEFTRFASDRRRSGPLLRRKPPLYPAELRALLSGQSVSAEAPARAVGSWKRLVIDGDDRRACRRGQGERRPRGREHR